MLVKLCFSCGVWSQGSLRFRRGTYEVMYGLGWLRDGGDRLIGGGSFDVEREWSKAHCIFPLVGAMDGQSQMAGHLRIIWSLRLWY